MASLSLVKGLDGITLQRLLRREAVDRIVLGLKVALVVAMAALLWLVVRELLRNYFAVSTEVEGLENEIQAKLSEATPNAGPASGPTDYTVIVSKNILGPLTSGAASGPVRPQAKPSSNTPLSLIGTFITEGQAPYAIIEDQKKSQQEVFNLKEMIFGEAKLIAIYPDRVEIERGGQTEVLVLDDIPAASAQFKDGVAVLDNNQYLVQEAELDKALENMPLLLTQARAVPYFKDGKSVGLRLFAIKSDSIFEKIGLRNADILKNVNDKSLGDLSQAMELFKTLKEERSINLKLERNNEEKEFKYEIR